ncbi:VCBS repeat-containing protein/YVTN family beta-propeller protein [Mycobacterium sp. OAS707]|nr:VCBS repeat-containing protein/YVTN family beta-propeller protein [Mycobacterium sp. OAS707]
MGRESSPPVTVSAAGGSNTTVADDTPKGKPGVDAVNAKPARKGSDSRKLAHNSSQLDSSVNAAESLSNVTTQPNPVDTPAPADVVKPPVSQVVLDSTLPALNSADAGGGTVASDVPSTSPTISVATTLLAVAGLDPSGTDLPSAPSSPPPAAAVVLAWQRRQSREELAADSSNTIDQATTTSLVDPNLATSSLVSPTGKPVKPPKPPLNHPPTTSYVPAKDEVVNGQIIGSLGAADPDGDVLTYRATGLDPGATFQITSPDGDFIYTPSPQATDPDDFTVTVSDIGAAGFRLKGKQALNHTTFVKLTLAAPNTNEAPFATSDPTQNLPTSDGVVIGNINVVDPDGDDLTYTVTDGPTYGSVTVDPNTGIYTYTPDPASRLQAALTTTTSETDSFTVAVTDGLHTPVAVTVPDIVVAELPTNSPIATVGVGQGPSVVVVNQHFAYVANTDDDSVTVLNASTNEVVTTFNGVGDRPVALALNSDGSTLYVANAGDSAVVAIDTATGTVGTPIQVDGEPTGMVLTENGDFLITANANDTLTIIDLATGTTTPITVDPIGLDVSDDGLLIYAANPDEGALTIIDRRPSGDIVNVPVGLGPYGVVATPSGDRIYVTLTDEDRVAVIDTTNDNFVTYVSVGDQPRGIDIAPDGKVYVADFGDDNIAIIDTTNNNAVTYVSVGDGPHDVTISEDGTEATITNSLDNTVTVLLLVGNDSPVVTSSLDNINLNTGVVTGHMTATDADNDSLTYTVSSNGTSGNAIIDPTTGQFTYTPDAAARRAAAATLGIDTDSFEILTDDGHGGLVPSTVTVEIAPAGILGQTPVDGTPNTSGPTLSPNGTLAAQVTLDSAQTPQVAVIDTVTGQQVGETAPLPTAQSVGVPVFNVDGSRVAVVTSQFDQASSTTHSSVSIINTATGEQVGSTVDATGNAFQGVQFSRDGQRAFMSTVVSNPDGTITTFVTVVDAINGGRIHTTPGVLGTSIDPVKFSTDGTRAYQTVSYIAPNQPVETRVQIINAVTGEQIGDPIVLDGAAAGGLQLFDGGDRALQTVDIRDPNTGQTIATRIYTLDLVNGTTAPGDPIEFAGAPGGPPQGNAVLNDDGTLAVQLILQGTTTRVAVIDTASGTVVNSATTVTGPAIRSPQFSDDGSHVVITTMTSSGGGPFGPPSSTTRVAVIEAATGNQVGSTYEVNAALTGGPQFAFDDTRVILQTRSSGNTAVTVLNADTGLAVGAPIPLGGGETGLTFSADGSRVFVTATSGGSPATSTATLTAVNLSDGSATSTPLGTGTAVGAPVIASDGKTAFQTVIVDDGGTQSTRLVIVDITGTPTVLGVIALEGTQPSFGDVRVTLSGSRLVVATASNDSTAVTVVNTAPFLVDPGL